METKELFNKLAEAHPEFYSYFLETQGEVQESPYKDEIVGELSHIVKEGMGQLANYAAGVGASIGAGIAYHLAGDLYDSLRRGLTKGRNYKNMLSENPDLKRQDGMKVRRAFEVLHNFNPEFSGNPVVAGSFVRDQVQLNELGNISMLSSLVSSHKSLADTKSLSTPGNLPIWDKEGPVERETKLKQLEKLKNEVGSQRSMLALDLQDKRQKRDLNKQKLDKNYGEHALRSRQIDNLPDREEAFTSSELNKQKLDRELTMMRYYDNSPYQPGWDEDSKKKMDEVSKRYYIPGGRKK